jgi:PAS domain S-box-containing protein
MSPKRLLAAIVDSSEDAIISKNLKAIVTSWNPAAERIFGYTAEEMVGQSITRLLPPERLEEESHILARLQRGERVEHFETIRMCKDGRLIHVSLSISPIKNEEGVVVGASKIARDITETKKAQANLAAAHEELKRADRMKTEFISMLSHELRTPLTAIIGWIQILKQGPSQEELTEGLQIIDRNVRAQSEMINDLLDMSRIEAGKLTLDVQALNLPTVVGAALDAVRLAAEAKGIRISSTCATIDGVVMGDRQRVQQIVWNLLSNAIKFTPKGGAVRTTVQRVESHVEITVSDSGAGFAQEFQERIFDRFSQADSAITRKHGGLGLGLAIVKQLTELHGGTVHAYSAGEGLGATFVVNLPLSPARSEAGSMDREGRDAAVDRAFAEADLRGIKVLAVDDDADSGGVVRRILARGGAEVRGASSMEEALAAFAEFSPDVILSDIGMPAHDGYELISRVRELPGGHAVPAVALTALARSEDRARALRAGFQMHVAKPVDASELLAVVRNLASLRPGAGAKAEIVQSS